MLPDVATTILMRIAYVRSGEIAAGREPVAIEVDVQLDALFAAAWAHYWHPYLTGKRLLTLPVKVSEKPGRRLIGRK